jgi:hypothetical protein
VVLLGRAAHSERLVPIGSEGPSVYVCRTGVWGLMVVVSCPSVCSWFNFKGADQQ